MSTNNKDLNSRTLATRMIACIEEYEAIKRKESKLFKTTSEIWLYTMRLKIVLTVATLKSSR